MPRALLLRHESPDTFGVAPEALRSVGIEPVAVDTWETGDDWPDVAGFDAFIVFGGSVSSLDDAVHPHLARERAMLRRAMEHDVPTLGVCLGAQLLAQACGASVARADVPEVGFKLLALTEAGKADPTLAPFRGAPAFQWHEDAFELPSSATLLATGEMNGIQAYRIGSALGVQFHPEITEDELEAWIDLAGGDMRIVWGRDPEDFRAEIRREIGAHNERGRAFFRAFAREALAVVARRSA
jgi:GMP synthase (glutamine-hydrolysing)